MGSIYTDDVREANYRKNKKTMKYLNYGYDHLMGIALIIGMGKALVMAFNGLTSGILSVDGNPAVLRDFFLFLIAAVVVIYTLSLKTVRSAAIALCVAFVCDLLAGLYSDVLLFVVLAILSLALAKCWEKLSEEEGFPLFDIPFSELEERKEIAEKRTRYQANLLGERERRVRTDASEIFARDYHAMPKEASPITTPVKEEMQDLLDFETAQIEKQNLEQYHDRSRDAMRNDPQLSENAKEMLHDVHILNDHAAVTPAQSTQENGKEGESYV